MSAIGVFARPDLAEAAPALRGLVGWLRERGVKVVLEERTAALADGSAPRGEWTLAPGAEVAAQVDAVVVLGGDGTLLGVSHLISTERPLPILGVNFGSLGFLTEITLPELYPTLESVLQGRYRYEERRMLRAVLRREGHPEVTGDVLNDVVGRHPGGLVYEEQSLDWRAIFGRAISRRLVHAPWWRPAS